LTVADAELELAALDIVARIGSAIASDAAPVAIPRVNFFIEMRVNNKNLEVHEGV
jgi:hypothetical protein